MIDKILQYSWQEFPDFNEVNNFVPKLIIDSHTHVSPLISSCEMINQTAISPGELFNFFPLELHSKIFSKILPKSIYKQVAFGFPHMYGHEKQSNDYLLNESLHNNCIITAILCQNEFIPEEKYLKNFSGVKMYRQYGKVKSETKIIDIFPDQILKTINSFSGNVVLHLPESLQNNMEELLHLAIKYKNVNFILAHMGVNYLNTPSFAEALKEISKYNNIFLDTAMVSDEEVFLIALRNLGHKKILFGSDAPFSFINANFCLDDNEKLRLKTSENFPWVKISYNNPDDDWPNNFFHYKIILSLKRAIEEYSGQKKIETIKQSIFYDNASRIFLK